MASKNGNNYNWNEIRQAYFEGASWDDLQDKFGCSRGAISKHYNAENWEDGKINHQKDLVDAVSKARKSANVHELVKFNEICEQGADTANQLVRNRLARINNTIIAAVREDPDSNALEEISFDLVEKLLKIQRMALENKRLIYNIPAPRLPIDFTRTDSPDELQDDEFMAALKEVAPDRFTSDKTE